MASVVSRGAIATLAGLVVHYACFYLFGTPLITDAIAQWVMARTPNAYAVWILQTLGPWAKPFAMTGALAAVGFAVYVGALTRSYLLVPFAVLYGWLFDYHSVAGNLSFWVVALVLCRPSGTEVPTELKLALQGRREVILMPLGVAAVALESYLRDLHLAGAATKPVDIAPFQPPPDTFAPNLVRKNVTPVAEFYGMSKNTVDPAPDPRTWALNLTVDGKLIRRITYSELLSLPRTSGYSTMRCVSNTLKSDLMGTAQWTGIRLRQLINPATLPTNIAEVAIVGVDGHGDSLPPAFAFSDGALLALGMNGKTLDRTHGFPLRLIVPRYYGFKNVKWIGEIAFVTVPYSGTWPKMGYTKEPRVHTGCYIDRIVTTSEEVRVGGVAFAGDRGINAVQVRADQGQWIDATVEPPLSPLTWRRWTAAIPAHSAFAIQARAMDATGAWQADRETPLFPDGVQGPTIRKAPRS